MKVIDLLNKIANGEEVPKIILFNSYKYQFDKIDNVYRRLNGNSTLGAIVELDIYLNDEVKIIEDKFTKEDFIKERMKLDGITREQFDDMYEVKECHCGAPYCKGFIAEEKYFEEEKDNFTGWKMYQNGKEVCSMDCSTEEEKKIPEKITVQDLLDLDTGSLLKRIVDNQNEIIDYLKSKGDK